MIAHVAPYDHWCSDPCSVEIGEMSPCGFLLERRGSTLIRVRKIKVVFEDGRKCIHNTLGEALAMLAEKGITPDAEEVARCRSSLTL